MIHDTARRQSQFIIGVHAGQGIELANPEMMQSKVDAATRGH